MSPWYCIEVTFGPCVTFSAWRLVLTPSLTFKCLASFERLAYVSLHSLQSQQHELSSAMLRVILSMKQAKTRHKHLYCPTPPRVIISGGCVAKSLRVSCKYNCSLDPVKSSYSKSLCAKLECYFMFGLECYHAWYVQGTMDELACGDGGNPIWEPCALCRWRCFRGASLTWFCTLQEWVPLWADLPICVLKCVETKASA